MYIVPIAQPDISAHGKKKKKGQRSESPIWLGIIKSRGGY